MKQQLPVRSKSRSFFTSSPFLALLYFTGMTIAMTWPLILRMHQIVGNTGGDGTYFVWLINWYQRALFELKISPFFSPFLNYPQGWNLASTDITPAMVALALPANLLFGPAVGYNVSMLLSFILSGWGMYLWVRSLTRNEPAALVAGTIYGFLPFHVARFVIGHFSLAGMQWFPCYFWGLYDLLRQEKFHWQPVLLAGISAGLIGATSPYYIYMTMLISVVFVAGFVLFRGWRQLKNSAFWKSVLAFGLLAGLLVGIAMLPYLGFNAANGLVSRPVEYLSEYSASPTDFVIPSIWHFLWGGWVDRTFSPEYWQEATLYIGAVAFVLACIAWFRKRRFEHPGLLNISLLVAFTAFVLALGIDLHWLGKKVTTLPVLLQRIFHRTDMPQVYFPAYYLYRYLPFFSKMRVMMRFGLFTLVFTSFMAGIGAHGLLEVVKPRVKRWLAIVLLVLVFIDFYPGPFKQFASLDARPVDYWLASQPGKGAIAQFPFRYESDQGMVYNTMVSRKPYLGGFFNANNPEQYLRIQPVMNGFPSPESVALLKELGVEYVVVDSAAYDDYPAVDRSIQLLGLKLLNQGSVQMVYGWP
jgi:hypothetical protein